MRSSFLGDSLPVEKQKARWEAGLLEGFIR